MKKIPVLLAALLAAGAIGCSSGGQSSPERMTQQIAAAPAVPSRARDSVSGQTSAEAAGQGQELPQGQAPLPEYPDEPDLLYRIKAEKKAVEIDKENLEAGFRVGKFTEEAFETQKYALKQQKKALEDQERQLKELYAGSQAAVPEDFSEENLDSLLQMHQETEDWEDALELEEQRLEASYQRGEISREAYVEKQAKIEKEDDFLGIREDALEDALERLGWDG